MKCDAFQLSHRIKIIHRSKLCQLHRQHWRKGFSHQPLLKVCASFLFRQSKKTRGILWSVGVFFAFLKRQNKYCLWEANLVFCMQVFGLTWRSVNLLWKTGILKCWFVFAYFYGGHKHNFCMLFRSSFNNLCISFLNLFIALTEIKNIH